MISTARVEISDDKKTLLEEYNAQLRELKSGTSALRKQGGDPFITELLLKNLESKMHWARVNQQKKDFEVIKTIMTKAKKELEEESKKELLDIKKEVLKIVDGKSEVTKLLKPEVEVKKEPEKIISPIIKTIKEKPEKKILDDPTKYFFVKNGTALKSINDLGIELTKMSDEEFAFYMRNEDNDFSKWLRDVFKEEELAKKIKGIKDKHELLAVLVDEKRGV